MNLILLDTMTGQKARVNDPLRVDTYAWTDGNYCCDCNREMFFPDVEEEDAGICQGEHRFLVIACDHPDYTFDSFNRGYPEELKERFRPETTA